MALHSIEPMYFSDISKNAFLFLVAQRRVNLPDKNCTVFKVCPKEEKTFFDLLVSQNPQKKFIFNCSVLFNIRMLSTNSQVK